MDSGVLYTSSERVAVGLPASSGMDAAEAILIKVNEGTYNPKKKSGSSTSTIGTDTTGITPKP